MWTEHGGGPKAATAAAAHSKRVEAVHLASMPAHLLQDEIEAIPLPEQDACVAPYRNVHISSLPQQIRIWVLEN